METAGRTLWRRVPMLPGIWFNTKPAGGTLDDYKKNCARCEPTVLVLASRAGSGAIANTLWD